MNELVAPNHTTIMKTLLLTVALLLAALPLTAQAQDAPKVIPLWEKGAPGFEDRRDEPEQAASYWVKNVHNPSLTVFLPSKDKATGAAVIVCPGGGFKELGFNGEGVAPAVRARSGGAMSNGWSGRDRTSSAVRRRDRVAASRPACS